MSDNITTHGCRFCGDLIPLSRLYCSQYCLRKGYNRELFPEKSEEAKMRRKTDKLIQRGDAR